MTHPHPEIKPRSSLGKYRIEKRLAKGGFAEVYRAYDTVEGIRVALKVLQPELLSRSALEDFKNEVRLTARLDHPNILKIKNANNIGERFVVVYDLGQESLDDRLKRRLSFEKAYDFAQQILAALAHAHEKGIQHCDVKPDNLILFGGSKLRLTDFGLAKLSFRTMHASGSGTIGYVAPEQAMGRPSMRSDVFSAGLVLYRMFTGTLPEWPFDWPPPGFDRARKKLHPDLLVLLRRGIEVDPRKRFSDAIQMREALQAVRARALRFSGPKAQKPKTRPKDWREVRLRQFQLRYERALEASHTCATCAGPVAESMLACPWCGRKRKKHLAETRFPARCTRCRRGVKLDWRYCPWCYGASIGPLSEREYGDKRYASRCPNGSCARREIMPFMRYCPWCRTKIRRPWPVPGSKERCPKCRWGTLHDYWTSCPWCVAALARKAVRHR